jgi:hypothetical protein
MIRTYPGVYLVELPFAAKPIESVPTSRSRTPSHTPEWTNHNDSDPGIGQLDLLAWMAESFLYRHDAGEFNAARASTARSAPLTTPPD